MKNLWIHNCLNPRYKWVHTLFVSYMLPIESNVLHNQRSLSLQVKGFNNILYYYYYFDHRLLHKIMIQISSSSDFESNRNE
jgi:hypothetical protein